MSRRTGGLTAVCVIAIVVGVLGVLSGLSQIANLTVGGRMQSAMLALQPQINPGMQAAQQEMLEKTLAVNAKYAIYLWISIGMQLVLALAMIVGAILALSMRPAGRRILLAALVASLLFEPARTVLTSTIVKETGPITAQYMQNLGKVSAPPGAKPPPGFEEMMGGMSQAVVAVQWVVLIGMAAAWCIFYLVGVWYLAQPAVKALFAPAAPSGPQWS
ncbi:MAG TPA: hypothetical protein VN699_13295 [Pirellulales bacterium]|nr:hypothetical protein [Pirellulales bacterium]